MILDDVDEIFYGFIEDAIKNDNKKYQFTGQNVLNLSLEELIK